MGFIKKWLGNLGDGSRKKWIENAAIVILIGIILLIAGGTLFGGGKKPSQDAEPPKGAKVVEASGASNQALNTNEEERLEAILAQIDGVGKVDVMITYATGKESVPAYDIRQSENNTQEKDSGGGTRSINQRESDRKLVYEDDQSGGKKPVIIKDLQPAVRGVVVVADGAREPQVRESICKAVQVAMDVPLHKIQVFERRK